MVQSLFSEPQDGKALSFVNARTKRLGISFAWFFVLKNTCSGRAFPNCGLVTCGVQANESCQGNGRGLKRVRLASRFATGGLESHPQPETLNLNPVPVVPVRQVAWIVCVQRSRGLILIVCQAQPTILNPMPRPHVDQENAGHPSVELQRILLSPTSPSFSAQSW